MDMPMAWVCAGCLGSVDAPNRSGLPVRSCQQLVPVFEHGGCCNLKELKPADYDSCDGRHPIEW